MSIETQIQDLKTASARWSEANPGLHPLEENYGRMLNEAADTIQKINSVKWRGINSRWKPKPKNSVWVYKSGWIYPVIAYMTTDGRFISAEYGEISPELWAPAVAPLAPKEVPVTAEESESDASSETFD